MSKNLKEKSEIILQHRDSNIEMFRIVVMLLIVSHHYVVNSGLLEPGGVAYSEPLSPKSLFLLVFGAWGKVGINCFVMITGYYMCKSHITFRKFMKLFCEVMFYRIVIYFVFFVTGYEPFALEIVVPVTIAEILIKC